MTSVIHNLVLRHAIVFDNIKVLIFCALGVKTPVYSQNDIFFRESDSLYGELYHRD